MPCVACIQDQTQLVQLLQRGLADILFSNCFNSRAAAAKQADRATPRHHTSAAQ
jgi:hypothetical protein